ncbi:MAG: DNA polymerase, partial [Anaerolineae bacterium]
ESEVLPVLVRMRRRGVRIDQDKLAEIEDWSLREEAAALEIVHRETGIKIAVGDVWKSKTLAPALEHIGLKLTETSTGQKSVSQDVFASIDHPVTKALAWARKTNKLRTTFAQSIRTHMTNGRIHCTFRQIAQETEKGDQRGARYGRLSATDPNLQQQPNAKKDPAFAGEWRKVYLPEEGALWSCNDYCFSDDTEVLTESGFKLFEDLERGELVAQWENGKITYTAPLDYQRVWYEGDMIHVAGRRQVDLLVSPNHNCILQRMNGAVFTIKANEYERQRAWQTQAGMLEGAEVENEDLLRVVVAIQADGSERTGNYRIWLKKPRKIDRLQNILVASGLTFHETFCEGKAAGHGFVIERSPRIDKYLAAGKLFKLQSLMALTAMLRSAFLDELELWDGSTKGHYYCSAERTNVETVQHLGVVTNRRCNLASRPLPSGKTIFSATLTKRTRTWVGKFKTRRVPYCGEIFCVTMPNHTVIVRRNGRVSVTAQSQQEPRWTTHFAALMDLPGARAAAKAYHDDPDLDNHQFMADLTGLKRDFAKNIYLGLCYGEGGAKLCDDLGLPTRWALAVGRGREREVMYFDTQEEALRRRGDFPTGFVWRAAGEEGQGILDTFDNHAPFIRLAAKAAEERAKQRGFVITGGGRRLNFSQSGDGSYDWTHKSFNRVIQGTSADQMKRAMVEIDRAGYWMMLQVHDETDNSVADRAEADRIAEIMSDAMPALVPFRVDVEIGPSWGEIA